MLGASPRNKTGERPRTVCAHLTRPHTGAVLFRGGEFERGSVCDCSRRESRTVRTPRTVEQFRTVRTAANSFEQREQVFTALPAPISCFPVGLPCLFP